MNGNTPGAPDDLCRHQSGPQPGEGGWTGGGDHGVKRTLCHLGSSHGLGEHLSEGLGVTAGIGLFVLAQHLQGACAGSGGGGVDDRELSPQGGVDGEDSHRTSLCPRVPR